MSGTRQPRLLLDEMFSGTIAAAIRARTVDATAVVEDVSLVGTPDEDLLAYATGESRTLVTANISDLAAIATDWRATGRTNHGLVYVAHRTFPQDRSLIGAITEALAQLCSSDVFPSPGDEIFLGRVQR